MKVIYADSLDFVDPHYDFVADQHAPGRQPYWDDHYPHELMGYAPYDGVLVSRAIVGDHRASGKYSETQAMRFRRVGARRFLRFDAAAFRDKWVFGDCGAFSYREQREPPYTPEDMVDFYRDGGFTHGCSIDHIIYEMDTGLGGMEGGSDEAHRRFELTLRLAAEFLTMSRGLGEGFTPVGVVQGWSPSSMAEAARRLYRMGYRYIALGGMVPLKTPEIRTILAAVRDAVGDDPTVALHILGFAKADDIDQFRGSGLSSFDTTSPLLRAFKDRKRNYYLRNGDAGIHYYTAIRVPQALENKTLLRKAKMGHYRQEDLLRLESRALAGLRGYDRGRIGLDETLGAVLDYARPLLWDDKKTQAANARLLATYEHDYRRTLQARPWKACGCPVCRAISVEAIIYRGSNRNKRRGIHNLGVFYQNLQEIRS